MKKTVSISTLVAVSLIVAALGIWIGSSVVPFPRSESCEVLINTLPAVVPQTTILRIRNDRGQLVASPLAPAVEEAFQGAITVFGLADRLLIDMGEFNYSEHPEAHILPVAILSENRMTVGFLEAHGRMCGNLVLLTPTGKPALDRRIVVHEIGHFLGLWHVEGTWMTPSAAKGTAETDWFNERQQEVLSYWSNVGEPYVPHWAWQKQVRKGGAQ